jgi:hypothetical protein
MPNFNLISGTSSLSFMVGDNDWTRVVFSQTEIDELGGRLMIISQGLQTLPRRTRLLAQPVKVTSYAGYFSSWNVTLYVPKTFEWGLDIHPRRSGAMIGNHYDVIDCVA